MTCYMFWGKASSYANFPILLNISKGPTIGGLSFPFFPNLINSFQGNTFNNTRLPPSYSLSFRVKSTYFLCPSWLLPVVLWLDLLYPWSFGLLRVRASCALQLHPNIREIDIIFPHGSHKAISRYWHTIYYRKKTQSTLSDHSKFFQVYCTDSHHSF